MDIHEFERRDFPKLRTLLAFSDYPDCDAMNDLKDDQIEWYSKTTKDRDSAAKNQDSGYRELLIGNVKKNCQNH